MARKWGSRFLSVMMLVLLSRYGSGQQHGSAQTTMQSQHGGALTALVARPTVECVADSASIVVGQTGVIRARGVSPAGRPLRYSFAASAGQVVATNEVAQLRTAGLMPQVVQVTCTVTDDLGATASKVIAVTLRKTAISIGQGATGPHLPHLPMPVPVPVPKPITKVESVHPPMSAAPPPPPPPATALPGPVEHTESATKEDVAVPPATAASEASPDHGTSSDKPVAADGYRQGEAFEAWKKGLKTGKIEYQVPTRMLMQHASMVTVVIHGYGDTATVSLPEATGSGSLTQSERMKVELLAEDHPGDFTIAPQGDVVQFVPINGATTWTWSVTPNVPGRKQLIVRASVIYPGGDEKMQQQLKPYVAVVAVNVPSTWERIVESYHADPLKWFSYVIPGGAGFTFLVGIVVWGWKKKKGKE